jgi:hypothetical protein
MLGSDQKVASIGKSGKEGQMKAVKIDLGKTDKSWGGLPWYDDVAKDEGHRCGKCTRVLRIYRRRLSSAMCRSLVRLYWLAKESPNKASFHVRQFDREGARGEFGVLSKWGLVHEVYDPEVRRRTGMWNITDLGKKFIKKKLDVPGFVLMRWGSVALGYAGSLVSAKDCLEYSGDFKYSKLVAKR